MKFKVILLFTILPFVSIAQDKLTLLDIYEIEFISDPQISLDGTKILYVRNFKDVMTDKNLSNIWIINFDGSNNQPVTTGNQVDNTPRWVSSDRIIYKSNKTGDSHVYQFWLNSRAEQQITNFKNNVNNIVVSPDGKQLAFTRFVDEAKDNFIKMPAKPEGAEWNDAPTYINDLNYRGDGQGYLKSGFNHIFTMSVGGGTPKQLTSGEFDFGAPVWSPDQSRLYFSANLHEDGEFDPRNSEIYELTLANNAIKALTARQGPDSRPVVSPDGKKIAYLGFDDRYQGYQLTNVYLMNADGSGVKSISEKFDRNPGQLTWKNNGEGLYFQYDDKGDTKIASMSLNG